MIGRLFLIISLTGFALYSCNSVGLGERMPGVEHHQEHAADSLNYQLLKEEVSGRNSTALSKYRFAELCLRLDKAPEAIDYLLSAYEAMPNDPDYPILLSKLYRQMGKNKEALQYAEAAAAMNYQSPSFYSYLADIYLDLDSTQLANQYLEKAIEMAPEWVESLQVKAKLHLKNADYPMAKSVLKNALLFDDKDAATYDLLVKAYLATAGLDSALAYNQKGLKLSGENLNLLENQASMLEQTNRPEAAVEIYERIVLKDKSKIDLFLKAGEALYANNNYTEGIKAFLKFIDAKPKEKSPYLRAGFGYEKTSQYKKAQELYQKALEVFPNDEELQARNQNMLFKTNKNISL